YRGRRAPGNCMQTANSPTPRAVMSITDDLDSDALISRLAGPLSPAARAAFRAAAEDALTRVPCWGEGAVYRAVASVQRMFRVPRSDRNAHWDIEQELRPTKLKSAPPNMAVISGMFVIASSAHAESASCIGVALRLSSPTTAWRGTVSRWPAIGFISRYSASIVAAMGVRSSPRRRCSQAICLYGWFVAGGTHDGPRACGAW